MVTKDYVQGKKWLVLGLLWQLIKMYLFKQISITTVPGLINLLQEGEDIEELMKLSPEQLLVRWVNHQLEKVGIRISIILIICWIKGQRE